MGVVCLGTLLSAQLSHEPKTTWGEKVHIKKSLKAVIEPQYDPSLRNSGNGDELQEGGEE